MLAWYSYNPRGMGLSAVVPNATVCSYTAGCAIGRHLTPEQRISWDDSRLSLGILLDTKKAELPDVLKGLHHSFLQDMQVLHDTAIYWVCDSTTNILTAAGREEVNKISRLYGTGKVLPEPS